MHPSGGFRAWRTQPPGAIGSRLSLFSGSSQERPCSAVFPPGDLFVPRFHRAFLPHTQRPPQAIPAVTETTNAIRTAGPTGMQAAAAAQEATTTSSSMEVTRRISRRNSVNVVSRMKFANGNTRTGKMRNFTVVRLRSATSRRGDNQRAIFSEGTVEPGVRLDLYRVTNLLQPHDREPGIRTGLPRRSSLSR